MKDEKYKLTVQWSGRTCRDHGLEESGEATGRHRSEGAPATHTHRQARAQGLPQGSSQTLDTHGVVARADSVSSPIICRSEGAVQVML